MKITIIGPTFPFRGGISHYTTLLCRVLRKEHEVQFISYLRQYPSFLFPGLTDKDPSDRPLRLEGVEHLIDSINPFTWFKAAEKTAEMQKEMPDDTKPTLEETTDATDTAEKAVDEVGRTVHDAKGKTDRGSQ